MEDFAFAFFISSLAVADEDKAVRGNCNRLQ